MSSLVVRNVAELTTNDPSLGEGALGRLTDAAFVVEDGKVAWVGSSSAAPAADESYDAEGRAVIPGFVDSHTHLVFAGERSAEFEARMAGQRYDGGGIASTVEATRAASVDELATATARRVAELAANGVTTLEIKSGYELTSDGERRDLEIARRFTEEVTWLGAHVVPKEFANDREGYLTLLTTTMLDACAPLAKWADVFCDRGAFSVEEAREVLRHARDRGLRSRLHANQLAHSGAVALAVELDAASVDHLTYLDDEDVDLLAASNTVATLLPGAEFSTRSPYPSARRLLSAGVTVALATDCNPGSSYVTSMPLVIALAVRELEMTCDEALWAATRGGATALRRDDVGHLGVGARADYAVLDAPRAAHLAYRPGGSVVAATFRATSPSSTPPLGAQAPVETSGPVVVTAAVPDDHATRVLEVRDLVVTYGTTTAVNHVNLEVRRGEIFGLLGPNGAGKTSTLSAVEGLINPRAGSIQVDGVDLARDPVAAKAKMGVQLQATSFSSDLSVRQIVRLYAGLYGVRLDPAELERGLTSVGLGAEAGKSFRELSGGQQQRLALHVALIHEPVLLLLDEPTSGLDPQSRRQLWGRLEHIRARGGSIILTTHSMEEAQAVCDRVAIIDHGVVLTTETPADLIIKHRDDPRVRAAAHGEVTLEDVFIGLTGSAIRE